MAGSIDNTYCESLVARALGGDEGAWQDLITHIWPELAALVRNSRTMGRFGRSDDHAHDVLTRLIERLRRDGGHGLRLYAPWHDKNPDKTFADWIRIVTVNLMRRYVHENLARQSGAVAAPAAEGSADGAPLPSVKRLLNEFSQSPAIERGARPPMTNLQTARELLAFGRARLPDVQYRALVAWIEAMSFDEIADELALEDAAAAERAVRAATAVLRRHFTSR